MAYQHILGAREHHSVRDVDAYRRAHELAIAKKRRHGHRVVVHGEPGTKVAYVNDGSWVVDCSCGAGNATDPEWGIALCFGCGAVHEHVEFPDEVAEIEATLLARPRTANRNWHPSESVEDLEAENEARGLPARSGD